MKKITIWTIVILLIGGGILYYSLKDKTVMQKVPIELQPIDPTTPTSVNTSETIPAPTDKSYSLTEIAIHNNESDCWTAVDGKVYDVTKAIPTHPGGRSNIMKGCGIDATAIFSRVSKHDINLLKQNLVGNLR